MAISARRGPVSAVAAAHADRSARAHAALFEALGSGRNLAGMLAGEFRIENHATSAADVVYYGEQGLREWLLDLLSLFEPGAEFGVDELIASGEDFAVAGFTISGVGALSGYPLQFSWSAATWFADGRAVKVAGYASGEDALTAVGLEP